MKPIVANSSNKLDILHLFRYSTHTIFHTQFCHTPSFTHHLSHTALSHTIFRTPSFTHIIFHTQLCYTPFFLHLLLCLSLLPRPRYNISGLLLEEVDLWGYPVLLFFAWHPPRRFRVRPPPCPSLITPHSSQHYSSHLTHHSTTHHTSLTHHSTTHHTSLITPHSSQHYSSHHLSITTRCRVAGAVHRASWRSCCARGRRWAAAGFRVAGALRRAFWSSCCARGRLLARVARSWLSCGRRITQSMARGWLSCITQSLEPAGPGLAFVWQAQYTEPPGRAAPRVGATWPASGVCAAGAVHRAFWRSCCARVRLLAS